MRNIPQPDGGRVETGVVQFGTDWPGVWIRGDDAFAFRMTIDDLFQCNLDGTIRRSRIMKLLNLLELLESSDTRNIENNGELPEQYGGIVPSPNVKGEFMPWPGIPKTNETGGE